MENIAPAKRALAALDDAPPAADAGRHKRISKKVTTAIDLMASGECKKIADAARQVGLSREHLSRELGKPHIAEALRNKTLRNLAIASARAGAVKTELLDSANEMVRDRSSTFILGLAGIQPAATPALNVNIELKAGYVIDLREDHEIEAKALPHHTVDQKPAPIEWRAAHVA